MPSSCSLWYSSTYPTLSRLSAVIGLSLTLGDRRDPVVYPALEHAQEAVKRWQHAFKVCERTIICVLELVRTAHHLKIGRADSLIDSPKQLGHHLGLKLLSTFKAPLFFGLVERTLATKERCSESHHRPYQPRAGRDECCQHLFAHCLPVSPTVMFGHDFRDNPPFIHQTAWKRNSMKFRCIAPPTLACWT